MVSIVRRIGRRVRRAIGVDLAPGAAEWRMQAALQRAASSHDIRGIVDVGASDGSWSIMARRYWPNATFLLIEAQAAHEDGLRASGMEYVLAAAGDKPGEIHFNAADLFGGVASYEATGAADITVPMTTVDIEVRRTGLPGPYLVKLDTHGFEREILLGAAETLRDSSLLFIESYNFELMAGALRFHELCGFLEERGFRCLDLADPMHRPKDGIFWQVDLIFARSDEPEYSDNAYG